MIEVAPGWQLDVERGPDWLFVRVHGDQNDLQQAPPLAESIWSLAAQHFTYRIVLELDAMGILHSSLLGQLVNLSKRVHAQGGVLRLVGLSPQNQEVLSHSRLGECFPAYHCRKDAVLGHRPQKPK